MKKKILIFTLLIITLFITGCTTKEVVTPSIFEKMMQTRNFTVSDQTSTKSQENKSLEISLIATTHDNRYSVEYYSFDSEMSAQVFYTQKQNELIATGSQAYTEVNVGNFSKYTLSYKDMYASISRISNTIVYVNANKNYSNEIKTLIKEIGY